MTLPLPIYDLVLLLDVQADEGTRAKVLADARAAIEAQGELLRQDDWGERALAYPIEHRTSAEYHLLQFHAAMTDLLSGLRRSLRIADEVLRFRIIKLKPGVPEAPDMRSSSAPSRPTEADPPAEVEVAVEVQPAAEAEPAAEVEVAVEVEPAAEVEPAVEVAVVEPS
jgi:small subunit ribosomal protein S6